MQNNPCIGKWQLALNAIEYIYSSARFYLTGVQGIYPVSNFMEMEENLYNGNIRAMVVNIPQLGNAGVYGYRYDQLNRIKGMNSFNGFANATNNLTAAAVLDYRERVTYDPNGNIRTYIRNGNAARFSMDSMTYTYKANNNQLDRVVDAATDASILQYPNYNDIKQGQIAGNYQYDAIGNLISDASEGITNINWTVYGKLDSITKSATNTTIKYGYDASGNRISKAVKVGIVTTNTIYVRDASGNIMAVYTKDAAINSGSLTQTEISMYGSSRLGVWNPNRNVATLAAIDYAAYSSTFIRGCKGFELTNHLGNVLVTVSDKRVGINDGTYNGAGVKLNATLDNFSDYFVAEVVTANDYYPGGMDIPGRQYNAATGYRYGFNGKEKDKESAVQYDYGFRIYDPRLVRFKSVDPLTKEFPWNSTYAFAENDVIRSIDLEGAEKYIVTGRIWTNSDGAQIKNLKVVTLPKPGPLGSGTLSTITVDRLKYTPNGISGDQFTVVQYQPAVSKPKSGIERFFDGLFGKANDNQGGGTGSSQGFGIIFTSDQDWGSTKTGTKNDAKLFAVSDNGIFDLSGNVREFGPLTKKGEIFKQELTELKDFLIKEKNLIPEVDKVSDAFSKSFGITDNLGDAVNTRSDNFKSNDKPRRIEIFSGAATPSNHTDHPNSLKTSASGKAPDTVYFNQPKTSTAKKKN